MVGSGPAAFYVVEHLFRRDGVVAEVDMFERLAAPFGLVRFGVAPDHPKIKNVIRVYEKLASDPRFRYFGNVDVGRHLTLDDLRRFYDAVCFATGAQTDRALGIPGEDLRGSHTATEFVAWYNGHPEYCGREFDLSGPRAAVIGVGNVAVDVVRILCSSAEELAATDIADHALAVLRESGIREVYMLGRRGPAQAAFTNQEVRELGDLAAADIVLDPAEVELDPLSRAQVEAAADRALAKKIEILREFAERPLAGKPRRLVMRFLVSPVAVIGDARGRVCGLRLVRNRLEPAADGSLRAVPTGETEELPVDIVFRSVGYKGVPLPGLPFDARTGTVPNREGRVIAAGGDPLPGLYVAGWIKRGPTGVIGTNKPDAGETVEAMLADLAAGRGLSPVEPDREAARAFVERVQPLVVTYDDWRKLDALEVERGRAQGRPRVKFVTVREMLEALGRDPRNTE